MIVVEHQDIELDYCLRCKGIWFDGGELELLVDNLGLASGLGSMKPAKSGERRHKCPRCRIAMDKVNLGGKPVLIDACPAGDGLWFDGGELKQVIEQSALGNRIISFLGDTIICGNK